MNVTILGCGAYGIALANVFLENNNNVCVWDKFEQEILESKEKYLSIKFTTNLEDAIDRADLIVIAIPVCFLDDTMKEMKKFYDGQDILIASKGIDTNNKLFAYEIVINNLGNVPFGVISGGSFAKDMLEKKVLGITLATKVDRIRDKVKNSFENNVVKLQCCDDVIGVSVCGAIKNVMAIGFGILDGSDYPPSSRFLFLTEAIYEIRELILTLGGNRDTVMSYAGIDDIMMTCTSNESRNYTLGSMIGKRLDEKDILYYKENTTIEGLGTSKAIYDLSLNNNIDLSITRVIYRILYESADINELILLLEKREA